MVAVTDYVSCLPWKLEFVEVWNMGMKMFDWYKPSVMPYYDLRVMRQRRYTFGWNEI